MLTITIQAVDFVIDSSLEQFIIDKLSKIDKHHENILNVQVFLRLEKMSSTRKNKSALIKINVPGKTIFHKTTSKKFESAIAASHDSIVVQMKKIKAKQAA